jgi:VWFA-related protein
MTSATVLLFDQLNTMLENQGYARKAMLKLLEATPPGQQIAIYLLGKHLTVIQDFTGSPETLASAVRKWSPNSLYLLMQDDENMDEVDRSSQCGPICQQIRNDMTKEALGKITQHLAGMPGRKSLIWLSDNPHGPGTQFLAPADIHLYSVLTRGVGSPGVNAWMRDTREKGGMPGFTPIALPMGDDIGRQRANSEIAAATGGAGFTDSRDISLAVQRAIEDATSSYTLGFYPDGDSLDNKFHALTVKLDKKRGRTLEVRYRPGYFAAANVHPSSAPASLDAVLANPLDATAIGLTALPGSSNGNYQVTLTVDLHDVHFETQDNRHAAMLSLSFATDTPRQIETEQLKLSFTDAEFAVARENGLIGTRTFPQKSPVRIIARDAATGIAGSIRVVPPAQ